MNIAVLFTGGTIGSTLAGDVIGTKTGAADGLLDMLPCVERDGHVEEITYQVYHPYTLLSENSTGLTIAQLAQSIREVVSEAKYTGSAKVALGNKGEAEDGTSVFTGLDGVIIMHAQIRWHIQRLRWAICLAIVTFRWFLCPATMC